MAIEVTSKRKRVTSVSKKASQGASKRLFSHNAQRVSVVERMMFTERLAMLLETGNPLHISLRSLQGNIENTYFKAAILDIAERVDNGLTLSAAFAGYPDIFDMTYTNQIAAGEEGGFVPAVLKQLLEMDKQRVDINNRLKGALFYPVFLGFFSIAVVVFVLVVVFPKFAELFSSIESSLPWTTKVLMQVSDLLAGQWQLILLSVAALLGGGQVLFRQQRYRLWLDQVKLKTPYIRTIFIQYYLVQTLRVLALSLGNGVSVLAALRSCDQVVDNDHYRQFLRITTSLVEEGGRISTGFEKSAFIPPLVKQMIRTGDESGNLPAVMVRIADYYEGELRKRIDTLSKMAEPVMLLVMGTFVGVLVSSLILPIFQISRSVH